MSHQQYRDVMRMGIHLLYQAAARAIALSAFCLLIMTTNFNEAEAAVEGHPAPASMPAQKKEFPVSAEAAPVRFRSDAEDYSGRIAGSLGFVLLVALSGFAAVYIMRRKEGLAGKGKATKGYEVRLLSFKRISPRLNVLMIDVGQGKVVTLADNGNSLLKLAEFDQGMAASLEAIDERSHEK